MEKDFIKFVANIMDVSEDCISLDTEYLSIPQWDSLMQIRLVAEIEEKYGVEIPIDEVPDINTLSDLFSYVREAGRP